MVMIFDLIRNLIISLTVIGTPLKLFIKLSKMGKQNKYKDLAGLSLPDRIVRQRELETEMKIPKFRVNASKPANQKSKSSISRSTSGKIKKKKKERKNSEMDPTTAMEKGKTGRKRKSSEIVDEERVENGGSKRKRRNRQETFTDGINEPKYDRHQEKKKKQMDEEIGSKKKMKNRHQEAIDSGDEEQLKSEKRSPGKEKKGDLKSKMLEKLSGARFRYINEILYTSTGTEANQLFDNDPQLFQVYHEGYRSQNQKWPFDPLENIIKQLNRTSSKLTIADLGCGEARLAASVNQKVHSFDLVAINARVVAADIANAPLPDSSIDTCVFCLSLMGTNLADYIAEANRILKNGGIMKIAEIRSRFESIGRFRRTVEKMGFQMKKNVKLPDDYFIQMDFEKVSNTEKRVKELSLKPCLYKKR